MTSQTADFTPVARKKRRNRVYQPRPLLEKVQRILDELCGQGEDAAWALEALNVLQENISAMRARPTRCSCLGLGSPESSDAARVQLAFLLYICDTLDLKKSDVTLYDPEFSDNDYKLFEDLGLRGLRTEPAHIAEGPTLYYMIHCEMTLYDEILRANESYLDRILLVGNRLHHYLENKPSHELEESASTLLRLALQITADVLRPSPGWPNSMAFTAVQRVECVDESDTKSDTLWTQDNKTLQNARTDEIDRAPSSGNTAPAVHDETTDELSRALDKLALRADGS